MDRRLERIICWFFGHAWSVFSKYDSNVDDHFYCRRCGKTEEYCE